MSSASSRSGGVVGKPARLWENIASLSTLQLLNYAVPLATVPYLVRVLGSSYFGLLSFAQALIIYFDVVADYGFNLSATRAVAAHRQDPEVLARIFWRTLAARTALMLASAVVLAVLVAAIPRLRETPFLYAAAFLTVVGTVTCPVWFFQGIEQMKFLTMAQSSARLLTVPALMMFVRQPDHYLRAAVIQGAVPIVSSLLLTPVLWRKVPRGPFLPQLGEIPAALREGWHVFIVNTSMVINASTTIVMLGLVAGNTAVGYYSAADKIVRAVSSMLTPVTQALYPHLNSLRAHSPEMAYRLMRRSYGWIILLAGAASVATFLLAAPVGRLLWGDAFIPSIAILRCLSPLPFLFALVNILGTQTMLVFEMDTQASRILLLTAAANIPLAAGLSVPMGALGAAASAVATALLTTLALAWSLRRQRGLLWRAVPEKTCVP
jgi:polysaccharide transporter, PST family